MLRLAGSTARRSRGGDELEPGGTVLADNWRGLFPFASVKASDNVRTTSVSDYPADGYGLHDMIGHTWEWTRDCYATPPVVKVRNDCCGVPNPRGGTLPASIEPGAASPRIGRKAFKGGSHLCAANYCQRYRPSRPTDRRCHQPHRLSLRVAD